MKGARRVARVPRKTAVSDSTRARRSPMSGGSPTLNTEAGRFVGSSDRPETATGKWGLIKDAALDYLSEQKQRYDSLTQRRQERLKEVFVYLFFVMLFTYVAMTARDTSSSYWYTTGLKSYFHGSGMPADVYTQGFKGFDDLASVTDIFFFAERLWLPLLRPFGDKAPLTIMGNNLIVGKVRMRQVRIDSNPCKVPSIFDGQSMECFSGYKTKYAQMRTDPDGTWRERYKLLNNNQSLPDPDWMVYRESTGNNHANSVFSATYGTGGYSLEVDLHNLSSTIEHMHMARDCGWIDLNHTRAVFFEMVFYNPNVNLFSTGLLSIEVSQSGGLYMMSTWRVVNLYRIARSRGKINLGFEFAMFAFVIYFLHKEFLDIKRKGRQYFKEGYNYLSFLNLLVFVIVLILEIYTIGRANTALNSDNLRDLGDYELHFLAFYTYQVYNLNAFNALLTWLRILKYVDLLSKSTKQFSATIAASGGDVFIVLLLFIVIFFGYSLAFYLSFGQEVAGYNSVTNSLLNLFLTVLGTFDFGELQKANRILGPVLFLTYILIMVFCVLNMFLTVIMKKYDEVSERLATDDDELPTHIRKLLLRTLKRGSVMVMGKPLQKGAPRVPDEAAKPADPMASDQLSKDECAEIFEIEKERLETIGILNVDQMMEIADINMDGVISISEIMEFKSKIDAEVNEGENEEEDTYLLMKILERTNAIIAEEKAMLALLQERLPNASTGGTSTISYKAP
eukprot:CAMPEP_0114556666 /NCGR_PEP_ID=MMETSP0114-20121206/9411_1 /TAXON_ID=31324 /ORGANISM="Goniomonas sp, Strain m" /LENGTH=734 /DNA_ID=CAMNT_0001741887 /DNA_START=14 /DNA_END=2218 /DNA_ORIENTATION=-